MKKSKEITLKIGDKLYKATWPKGIFTYEVISIRDYGADKPKHYEIECKHCRDHSPCRVVIVQGEYNGEFIFVSMANFEGEDDDSQAHFHTTDDKEVYCTTLRACREKYYTRYICEVEKRLEEREELVRQTKAELHKLKVALGEIDND